MSEGIPKSWEIQKLSKLVSDKELGTTSRGVGETNVRLIKMGNLQDGKIATKNTEFLGCNDDIEHLTLHRGDFLFNTRNTPELVGKVSTFLGKERAVFDNNILRLNFFDFIDSIYMGYFFNLSSSRRNLKRFVSGTTSVAAIYWNDLKNFIVPYPPLPEQKKIAAILTSVDEVIESTQQQINKLQDLKKATMNELLTQGIGHTEFKDTELGRIPKSWELVKIETLSDFVTSGSRGWSQYYSSKGSLFIRIGNLTRDHINLKFSDIQLVEPPSGGEGTRTKVKVGDILVSITADLGVIGVVNESLGEAYINQHVCLIRLESVNDVNPRWVGNFLSGHASQEQFEKKNDSGTKAGLNLPTIRSIVVPVPSLQEQNQVVHILDGLDEEISIKQKKRAKHQSLKKSLMQDLLTGKVRVTVN
jgi:type I restriction enzyme S subunit